MKCRNEQGFIPLIVVAVIALLGIGSTTTVLAAQASKPGDALFPLRQGIEGTELSLASSPISKAKAHLQIAKTHKEELDALQASGASSADLADTADKLSESEQAAENELESADTEGKDTTEVRQVLESEFGNNTIVLERVLAKAPEQAKSALEHAIEVSKHTRKNNAGILNAKSMEKEKAESTDTSKVPSSTDKSSMTKPKAKSSDGSHATGVTSGSGSVDASGPSSESSSSNETESHGGSGSGSSSSGSGSGSGSGGSH